MAGTSGNKQTDQEQFLMDQLKSILLKEDRADIADVKDTLEEPEKLSQKINPIIEHHLEQLKRNFPIAYEQKVNSIVEQKLKSSQDEILSVIYPVMGKMIRKYISQQLQILKDEIDKQVKSTFSSKGILGRIKAKAFGIRDSEVILGAIGDAQIEEIYVIQRDSGILLGSFSNNSSIDQDVIAGMLTAIKSFVEDAFKREQQELELIQYGNYDLMIHSFYAYYVAIVLSGSLSSQEKDQLTTKTIDLAEQELTPLVKPDEDHFEAISKRLQLFIESLVTNKQE